MNRFEIERYTPFGLPCGVSLAGASFPLQSRHCSAVMFSWQGLCCFEHVPSLNRYVFKTSILVGACIDPSPHSPSHWICPWIYPWIYPWTCAFDIPLNILLDISRDTLQDISIFLHMYICYLIQPIFHILRIITSRATKCHSIPPK